MKIFSRFCLLSLIALFIMICALPVLSAEDMPSENLSTDEESSEWKIRGGLKGSYASGISDPSYTLKPFLEGRYAYKWFELLAGFTWHQHYQVTDGAGNYGYITIAQPGAKLSVFPTDYLEISGGYRYLKGGLEYDAHDYSAGIDLDFDAVSIGGAYGGKVEEYTFNTIVMKSLFNTASLDIAYYITESFSIDGGFEYYTTYYEAFDSTYTKAGGRLGLLAKPWKPLTITAGAGCARDSSDYNLFSADASLMIKFLDHYSLSVMYMLTYYQAPPEETTKSGGSAKPGKGNNPLLEPSLAGTSFAAHSLNFGVQFSF